jgi:hypothetical protein
MADEADREKERDDEPIDVMSTLDEIEMTVRETQVLKRSNRIRKACEFIPENAVKKRKAFFCAAGTGYLNKEPGAANQMNMMTDPNMMNNMLKQNGQGIIYMVMF